MTIVATRFFDIFLLFFSAKIEIFLKIGLRFVLRIGFGITEIAPESRKLERIWWSCRWWSRRGFIDRRVFRLARTSYSPFSTGFEITKSVRNRGNGGLIWWKQLLLVIVKLAIDKSRVRRKLASGGGELGRRRCVCERSFVFVFLFPEFCGSFQSYFGFWSVGRYGYLPFLEIVDIGFWSIW
jgi:hypothetical protein